MRLILSILAGIVVLVGLIEKSSRYTYDPKVFNQAVVADVHYHWSGGKPGNSALADTANIGEHRKWLGLKTYNVAIAIPSYQAHSAGRYNIRRESIVAVSPVSGETYDCSNNFWTVVCVGKFKYRLDPHSTLFEVGGRIVTRPSSWWLEDTRRAELIVYKYF